MNNDNLAACISNVLLKLQKGFASFMNKRTARLSTRGMKAMFTGLCSLFIFLSSWFIVDAIKKKSAASFFNVAHIKIIPPLKPRELPLAFVTTDTYARLQVFHRYMDSLRGTLTGKFVYDSITAVRPGLMDSVKELEKIYLSQQIK